jgi:hypothetical protein
MGTWIGRRLALSVLVAACASCAVEEVSTPTWTLREEVRIGSGDEGPTSFSWVKGIAADSLGRIFVYEHSTQDIRVFGPDGAYLKTIGRKGAGPGELGNAEGIVFADNGELWVRDAANGRFSVFNAEGDFLHAWPASFCWSQGTWMPKVAPGRLVDFDCVVRPGAGGAERLTVLVGYRTDRSGVDTLRTRPDCDVENLSEAATWITRTDRSTSYRQIPYAPRAESAFGPSGEDWCASNSSRYDVLRHGVNGDTVRVTRTLPPIPVTAGERDSLIADIDSRGPTGVDFSRIPQVKPAIERLVVDDDGRLWVRRSDPALGLVFDLFGPRGEMLATVTLGRIRTAVWSPFVVRGDDVYLVLLGEDDVPQVGRFTIQR